MLPSLPARLKDCLEQVSGAVASFVVACRSVVEQTIPYESSWRFHGRGQDEMAAAFIQKYLKASTLHQQAYLPLVACVWRER